MNPSHTNKTSSIVLFIAGAVFGALAFESPFSDAEADERRKGKVAFQSGSERSVEVLKKISTQIESLDKRLESIEKAVTKTAGKK